MTSYFNCKDCPERTHKCHTTCDKYKKAKAEWERIKKLGKPYRDYTSYSAGVTRKKSAKNAKRRKKQEGYTNFKR